MLDFKQKGNKNQNTEIDIGEEQYCFVIENTCLCNFVIRNGKVIRPKNAKYLTFPLSFKSKKKVDKEDNKRKNADIK